MDIGDGDTWQHWEIADQTKSVEELYTGQERVERLKRAICRLQPTLRNVVEIHQSEAAVLFHTFYFDLMADKAYRPTFERTRGDFVERKVRQYVMRAFPGHMVLSNPTYPNGEEFSDVAVLHDGKIMIFQCKAKGLTRDARVGADFSKLRSDMQAAIRSAFDQAVRARAYIRSTDRPSLTTGGLTLNIDGEMITDIYLINVTMMPLLPFASRFENIEEALGLFPEKEYPFSIALGDLDILTQLLATPAKLLHYVNRRLSVEKTTFGIHADEMDLLGFYLSQGMYFEVPGSKR